MDNDSKLNIRGGLLRSLGLLREMLPGSFVESTLKCGKARCRCAEGKLLHSHFVLSALIDGKPRTFHIPAEMVEQVREKVGMHKKFQRAETRICRINLERFLAEKEERKKKKSDRKRS